MKKLYWINFYINTTTKKLFFVHTNNLGSTIALTDSSGSLILSYDYDSYGRTYILNSSGTYVSIYDYKGNLHGNDRLYTGREYDSETNLYFYRARYYSPGLGRFISRDPSGMIVISEIYIETQDYSLEESMTVKLIYTSTELDIIVQN